MFFNCVGDVVVVYDTSNGDWWQVRLDVNERLSYSVLHDFNLVMDRPQRLLLFFLLREFDKKLIPLYMGTISG